MKKLTLISTHDDNHTLIVHADDNYCVSQRQYNRIVADIPNGMKNAYIEPLRNKRYRIEIAEGHTNNNNTYKGT